MNLSSGCFPADFANAIAIAPAIAGAIAVVYAHVTVNVTPMNRRPR